MDPREPLINPRANNDPRGKSQAEETTHQDLLRDVCLGGCGHWARKGEGEYTTPPWRTGLDRSFVRSFVRVYRREGLGNILIPHYGL